MSMNQFDGLRINGIYNRPPYPPGLMFNPTDEELIKYYLKPKVNGKQVPCNIIIDVDLYKYHPKELAEKYKSLVNDAWYIFTSRNRKYANGSRPNRSAGLGYWKATGSDQEIVDKANKQPLGYKKSLVYHEGRQPSKDKTGWMMLEYRTDGSCIPANPADKTMLLDSWVLCKIFHKPVNHSGGSKDNGSVEKDTPLEAIIEENPTKQHEQNPAEQPDSQNSEHVEPQMDFSFLDDILLDDPEFRLSHGSSLA